MKRIWIVFRAVVSLLMLVAVGVPAVLYVLLSVDSVQKHIRTITDTELSHLLGARFNIGQLSIRPFNRVMLSDIVLVDSAGTDTMATIGRISAGIELWKLLADGKIVVDYAMVDGLRLNVWRADSSAPLNVQPVLDHLRSDKPRDRSTPFELRINTVIVRRASASYDILSAAPADSGRFDRNHIRIDDMALNAYIPNISPHSVGVDLDYLSARERCGFNLRRLSAKLDFTDNTLSVSDLYIDLNRSHLGFEPLTIHLGGNIADSLAVYPIEVQTALGTVIYPSDFSPVIPILGTLNRGLALSIDAWFNADSLRLRNLSLESIGDASANSFSLSTSGWAAGLKNNTDDLRYSTDQFRIDLNGHSIASSIGTALPAKLRAIMLRIPQTQITADAHGTSHKGIFRLSLESDSGTIAADGNFVRRPYSTALRTNVTFDNFNAAMAAPGSGLGRLSGTISGDATIGRKITGNVRADFEQIVWNSYHYRNFTARIDMPRADRCEATINLDDPNATALIYAFYDHPADSLQTLSATAALANISLEELGIKDPKPGYRAGAKLIAQLSGDNIDNIAGTIDITDLRWLNDRNQGLRMPRLTVSACPRNYPQSIKVSSELLEGEISGRYCLSAIPAQLKAMAATYMPALFANEVEPHPIDRRKKRPVGENCFDYEFTLNSTEAISNFFGIGAAVVYPTQIKGHVDSRNGLASLQIDAPYILQGEKIYNNTVVYAGLDSSKGCSRVYLTTQFPTKKGPMVLAGNLTAASNRIDTRLDWTIERRIPINGTIDFSTEIRSLVGKADGWVAPVDATVTFNPGTVNFGDETWEIMPSTISSGPEGVVISQFALNSGSQHISLDGKVSHNDTDTLTIDLRSVQLLPVFETLEIDKAMLSGSATGTFKAASLFTDDRFLECPALQVDGIGYNRCTIGDADILARWDGDKQSFFLDADIVGDGGRRSRITGDIFPLAEALDLSFHADSVPVGFLKPFMEAFARDITGRASGDCRLFGTFKEIDLTGDIWADNISMAVDFTNTVYTTSDSVHMRPGRIIVPRTVMHDPEGHTAEIEGWVNHVFFKEPSYRFDVSNARNFLAYNGTRSQNPDWYGTIYGNGTAAVFGEPGIVNIEADMATGPKSTFTFVLTDRLDAADYSFITFNDVTPDSLRIAERATDDVPLIVRQIQNRLAEQTQDDPSAYRMMLSVDITPQAALTLVMDPASGDEIKATGAGHMTMTYNSTDEDLRIYGAYSVATGSYHFTLQDIIIKDFTIKEGSTINFDGDPYAVRSDLQAYYATTANLSDLDGSFLQDREVARTKVPVHALMNVRGDIRQPEISFDLEFPTLTDDTYRKVRSIVSTNDMMNRQIIYLLALNRFYTPDYMNQTTKGSELFSVASSTLSSQLSSLLGKISDNWSISPTLRSDRGDFSDIEMDVTLSSRLLNNRLLFNGNFGYRDKAMNSNQFVGDFDIEYLINPRGTWRLKAYNRYNDANYYLRSAATTQGVGIMYQRDFDNLFSFLRRKKPQPADTVVAPADTIPAQSAPRTE